MHKFFDIKIDTWLLFTIKMAACYNKLKTTKYKKLSLKNQKQKKLEYENM